MNVFRMPLRRSLSRAAAVVALAAGASIVSIASASVTSVDIATNTSVKGLGTVTGSASFDDSTDLLTIVLTNASATKGSMSGFAFDIGDSAKAVYEKSAADRGFKSVAGKKGVRIKPFGKYGVEVASAAGAKRLIGQDATKTFVFKVSNAAAGTTAFDLLDNPSGESVVALFKGFKHVGKDRVGATVSVPVVPSLSDSVPSPDASLDSPAGPSSSDPTIASLDPTQGKGPTSAPIVGSSLPVIGGASDPNSPAAVPLPPTAWSALATLALITGVSFKRKSARATA